jgi:hypothetical protein
MSKKIKRALLLLLIGVNCAFGQDSNKLYFDLSDKSCRQAYNFSYQELLKQVLKFNNGTIKKGALISHVLSIDTFIASKRLLCLVIEPSSNKKCVEIYKKRFKVLRDEVQISAILLEDQLEIDRDIIETIRSEFNTLYIRLQCGNF